MNTSSSLELASWRHPWQIRLRLWRRNLAEFFGELLQHPIALLGGVIVLLFILGAIFATHITRYDPYIGSLRDRLQPPMWREGGSPEHILGTDAQGRDLATRIVYGARVSLAVGILTVVISVAVGGATGSLAGYYRGKLDTGLSRFADLLMAFPFLIFAIAMMAFIGPGFGNLIFALTFKGWVEFFRLVRGETMSEKTKEYVEAAHALGRGNSAIIVSEILPNILQSVLVLATLRMGFFIVTEASLSFLGLGIQPPTPAWGSMVAEGRDVMLSAWWVSTFPGLAIVFLVLSLNLLGEGLRDILDPRLKVE
ncbi:MAG: ABC transporter permease subunit [Anaerolineae bacterium]|nr:MAG: ABC transporter permease subunit [Anaerolineae bacterium]